MLDVSVLSKFALKGTTQPMAVAAADILQGSDHGRRHCECHKNILADIHGHQCTDGFTGPILISRSGIFGVVHHHVTAEFILGNDALNHGAVFVFDFDGLGDGSQFLATEQHSEQDQNRHQIGRQDHFGGASPGISARAAMDPGQC